MSIGNLCTFCSSQGWYTASQCGPRNAAETSRNGNGQKTVKPLESVALEPSSGGEVNRMRDDFHPASPALGPGNDSRAIRLLFDVTRDKGGPFACRKWTIRRANSGPRKWGSCAAAEELVVKKGNPGVKVLLRLGRWNADQIHCASRDFRAGKEKACAGRREPWCWCCSNLKIIVLAGTYRLRLGNPMPGRIGLAEIQVDWNRMQNFESSRSGKHFSLKRGWRHGYLVSSPRSLPETTQACR